MMNATTERLQVINGEIYFDGKPTERHRGSSGGYRHTYVTADGDILKVDYDYKKGREEWVMRQCEQVLRLFMEIAPEDEKFFARLIDFGTYPDSNGDPCTWILEKKEDAKFEMGLKVIRTQYGEGVDEVFDEILHTLLRKYNIADVSCVEYTAWNVAVKDGWPLLYDFGSVRRFNNEYFPANSESTDTSEDTEYTEDSE